MTQLYTDRFKSLISYVIYCNSCLLVFIYCEILTVSVLLALLVGFLSGADKDSNIVMMATFMVTVVDAIICILVILGGIVSVYIKSKVTLQATKRLGFGISCKRSRNWMRRFFRSCDVIKIKFGDNNFLEELTPFKCLDFSLNLTVQFLLLSLNK